MHCDILWILDKRTLRYAALSIVYRVSRLAISEKDAGDYWNVVCSIASTGVPKVFLVKAGELEVNALFTAFMLVLWDSNGYQSWFWGFCSVALA